MKRCETCNGLGFVCSNSNSDEIEIQRCDNCDKYQTDDQATVACFDAAETHLMDT